MKTIKFNNKEFGEITLFIYETPKEFTDCEYQPFGEIPDEYWEIGKFFINDGLSTGFAVPDDNSIHYYKESTCSFEETLSTIGHELGHLLPKFRNTNSEKRADLMGELALLSFQITKEIYEDNKIQQQRV